MDVWIKRKLKRRNLDFFFCILCFLLSAFCLFMAFGPKDDRDSVEKIEDVKVVKPELFPGENVPDKKPEIQPKPYQSPINFPLLQGKNKDIYAWLSIPGTDIDYPLVQSPKDSQFYLSHDSFGVKNRAGAIFTEKEYNSTTLTDPVTLIYGHKMRSGARFGILQDLYQSQESFNRHQEIVIYMPEKEIHYQVFAAVPFSNTHIMYHYDFHKKSSFDDFLHTVFTSDGVFDDSLEIHSSDTVVVLSTCLNRNSHRRFLVLAKQVRIVGKEVV